MAGTGAGGFCDRWFLQANGRMVVRCVEHLNYHTQRNLQSLWTDYKEEFDISDDLTTTVYHFGFSEEGGIRSFAYRSTNDFCPEEIPYGIAVKPRCEVPEDYQLPDVLLGLMLAQRNIQAEEPEEERVYIGGQIQVHHLTRAGITIHTQADFPDFDSDEEEIYRNFNAQSS